MVSLAMVWFLSSDTEMGACINVDQKTKFARWYLCSIVAELGPAFLLLAIPQFLKSLDVRLY